MFQDQKNQRGGTQQPSFEDSAADELLRRQRDDNESGDFNTNTYQLEQQRQQQHHQLFMGTNPNSSIVASSQESSMTGQGLITYNKTILVRPEELIFNQVGVNQAYSQVLTMQNTLSAPVEIILKSSNLERLEVAPKQLRLAPHETCQVTASFRQPRPFPAKTTKQKETIFIKSDFFDQKIGVAIFPASINGNNNPSESSSLNQRANSHHTTQTTAFNQATSTMSRQQLATTTIGKGSRSPTSARGGNRAISSAINGADMGVNDSFGRATVASDLQRHEDQVAVPGETLLANAKIQQNSRRQMVEFDPAIQQSDAVEVTMAAGDSRQVDVVSGAHVYLGGEFGRGQGHQQQHVVHATHQQFESHETNLIRQQLNEIRDQNESLKAQLAQALASAATAAISQQSSEQVADSCNLEQIKALLREREPKLEELLTEAMKHERATQKRKDAKVLEILQFKDQQVTELTQALADHQVLLQNTVQESLQKQAMVENQLNDANEKLRQLDCGNQSAASAEDKFQELIRSQIKVNEQSESIEALKSRVVTLQAQLDQNSATKAFLEEASERARNQVNLSKLSLDQCEDDLADERKKNNRLDDQCKALQMQLEKMTEQALAGKDSEISHVAQDRDLKLQLQRLELENAKLQEKVFYKHDQMQQVFKTLGKVTGDSANHLASDSKASTENNFEDPSQRLSAISGFDQQQLTQRADEIVLIVEQVQAQYTLLEKELRSLVNKAPSHPLAIQTDLKGSDIEDMYRHFEALQTQVMDRQQNNEHTTMQQLNEAKQEIDSLREALRKQPKKEMNHNRLWNDGSSENLLTNRHSQEGGDTRGMVPSEILISERGAQEQRNHHNIAGGGTNQYYQQNQTSKNNLGMSVFSAKTAGSAHQTYGNHQQQVKLLKATNSQGTLLGQPASHQPTINLQQEQREYQLLDQLSVLKEQMRFQTSQSEVNTLGGDLTVFAQEHLNLRVGELETLVFQQREQILSLQDHNSNLQVQLNDRIEENRHKLELYEVRTHNLQELNQKYQEAAASSKLINSAAGAEAANSYLPTTYTSASGANGGIGLPTSPDYKTTQVETERIRQHAQQQEMKVMDLQHALKEAHISLKHTQYAKDEIQGKLSKCEQDLVRFQQDTLLQKAGLNLHDSKLAMLVQELKNRIKKMEETDHRGNKTSVVELSATNQHHTPLTQQTQTSLYALREEYCTKLEKLAEANAEERSEFKGQQMTLKQKIDQQASQLKAMEEKEMKLFSQLEDLRSQHTLDEDSWNGKVKDLTVILDQKQQVCGDLEREVKQKEKMLAERQEQLSILLSAMEQQSSIAASQAQYSDDGAHQQQSPLEDAKQRLANMAAELCSLKAVEAQMERRCADLAHHETQAAQKSQKLDQRLVESQGKVAMLTRKVQTLESSNELLERQRHDLSNRTEEVGRERTDHQYKLERLLFQLKTKEETIVCLKTQATQAEAHFKEQMDRIRDDLVMKQNFATLGRNRDYSSTTDSQTCHSSNEHRPRREVALKIAIQQLHLVIADYIERANSDQVPTSMEEAQKNIIEEMEKALGVAQTTIQRLEGDLDRERHKSGQLENEWDALALNGILITRQERMAAQLKSVGKILQNRESQSVEATRQQSDSLNRVIREHETKIDGQAKLVAELDQETQGIKLANKRLIGENEELQTSLMCYAQEQAALKQAMEKKAQITVDERQRQRTDSLQMYFDETLAKLLIGSGTDIEKVQVLTREISAHKILIDKQRRDIDMLTAEKEGLLTNLRFHKGQGEEFANKLKDLQNRSAQDQVKVESYETGANRNTLLDKRKQECLSLEKELIRQRELADLKSREVNTLVQRIEAHKFEHTQNQLGQDLQGIADKKSKDLANDSSEVANQKIQHLQEQLMEIRGCHIQELEELKVQCDIDVAEARRELSLQQRQFETKFMPGTAPGEILDQNHELRERVAKLQIELDHVCQDSDQLRNQLFENGQQNEILHGELQERDQALAELEQTLIITEQQPPAVMSQTVPTNNMKSALKRGSSQNNRKVSGEQQNQNEANRSLTMDQMGDSTQDHQFRFNPPLIVRELFNAKRAELAAKQKLRVQLQTEVKLRQQLTNQLSDDLHQQRINQTQTMPSDDNTFALVGEDIVNQLMAQNANILSILQQDLHYQQDSSQGAYSAEQDQDGNSFKQKEKTESLSADFELLIRTVICFAGQMAQKASILPSSGGVDHQSDRGSGGILQQDSLQMVNEAQRVVIRAMTQRHQADRIRYGPEREVDRKVWYLELLEEQVADAEGQTTKLQDFVKRLQIGVSGNLHSAAEIKASSMDLAAHLKQASEEIKTLRHVAGLIKHDVLSLQDNRVNNGALNHGQSIGATSHHNDFNPFLTGRNNNEQQQHHMASMKTLDAGMDLQTTHLQQTQRSNMERLLNEHESVYNQLNLTSKIKQSLEGELVQSKLAHASEMQQVIQKMSTAEKKMHEMSQTRTQLLNDQKQKEELVQRREDELTELKSKLSEMEITLQGSKLEAVKARGSSKHWQKMQADMQEWRRSNEESLRGKQKQIQDSQTKITQLKADKKRMKAEVTMLRQNQKEIRDGTAFEQLKGENKQLVAKFNEQLDERKKEIEFWVQERGQMRDKIDQLESVANVVPGQLFNNKLDYAPENDDSKQFEKLTRKLKTKETEIKQIKSDLLEKKNLISKAELKIVKLEAAMRETQTNQTDSADKLTLATNRAKELEIEKEMLLARQKMQMHVVDQDSVQIGAELDKLREEFARLKVQRDELENETIQAAEREKQWRDTIDKLNRELVGLQNSLNKKENETGESLSLHEKKSQALLSDLRFMRDENQKLHQKLRETNECIIMMEQHVAQANQAQTEMQMAKDALKRDFDDQGGANRTKDLKIAECQATLQANETAYFTKLKSMQGALSEVKQESMQTQQLLHTQIELLKTRLMADKKATSKEIDQTLSLTQKETLLKHAKKDLVASKSEVAKLKTKNRNLKQQIDQIPQKQPQAAAQPMSRRKPLQNQDIPASTTQQPSSSADVLQQELIARLAQTDGLQKLLNASKQVNELEAQITEGQIEITKVENWNYALQQQLDEAKGMLEQTEEKITDLIREKKELSKAKNQASSQSEKALKEQVKQLSADIQKIRDEWCSPQQITAYAENIHQLQATVKNLQAENQRKAKHLGQVKIQKEQTSKETSQVQTELQGLKDENTRLKAQVKEASKQDKLCRDFRGQVEWLTKSEKRLKEELLQLNEKLKQVRTELTRKDQHLRDYKDRMDLIQTEVAGRGGLEGEVNKLKDLNRRQKVDLEMRDNQVKTLRSKLEQKQGDMQTLEEEKSNLEQQDSELGAKFRTQKQKAKRYETNLMKSMTVLKKIGVELAVLQQQKSSIQSARFGDNIAGSPDDRRPIQVYKREQSSSAAGTGQHNQQQISTIGTGRRDCGPMGMDDLSKDAAYYKDSVEILGLSLNEMESFINPMAAAAQQQVSPNKQHQYQQSTISLVSSGGTPVRQSQANRALLEKLQRIDNVVQPRDLANIGNQDIEEIGDYCVKLINDVSVL